MPSIRCKFVVLLALCLCSSQAARPSISAVLGVKQIEDQPGDSFRYTCRYTCRYVSHKGSGRADAFIHLPFYEVRKCTKKKGKELCLDPDVGCKLPGTKKRAGLVNRYQGFCILALKSAMSKCAGLGEKPAFTNVSTPAYLPTEWRTTAEIDLRAHAHGGPPTSPMKPGSLIKEGKKYSLYADEEALAHACGSDQLLAKKLAMDKLRGLAASEREGMWDTLTNPGISQDRFDLIQGLRNSKATNQERNYQMIQDQLNMWEKQDTEEAVSSFQAKHWKKLFDT